MSGSRSGEDADEKRPSNALLGLTQLRHRYFLVRHGQSRPNIKGIIVSNPADGVKDENGLTDLGKEQARGAGEEIAQLLQGVSASGDEEGAKGEMFFPTIDSPHEDVYILSSDFSRAHQTALGIQEVLKDAVKELKLEPLLRERWFGRWDGQSDEHYNDIWKEDVKDPSHEHEGVESAAAVQHRSTSVVARLEAEHVDARKTFILVSHGDLIQILQTGFLKLDPRQHRTLPNLGNCEVRCPTLAQG